MAQINQPKCPHCGGMITQKFQTWQIIVAILLFPWGLIALAVPRKWKCSVCGQWVDNNMYKTTTTPTMSINTIQSNNNNSAPKKNTYTTLEKIGVCLIALGAFSFGLSILDGISVGYMVCSIIMCIVGAILTFIGRKKEKGEDIKIPNPFKSISHNHTNSAFKAMKNTKVFRYANKNKLWLIPSVIALCVVIIFVSSAIKKSNYIKHEFAYASQAQASENYDEALYHIDNILLKDEANEKALTMKTELEGLQKKQTVTNNIKDAKIYKDEGKYIEAYNKIISTLDIDPENEEALKLKDELLPLYQAQKQQQEEEQARKDAERKAEQEAKEKAEAEEKAQREADDAERKAARQNDVKTLVDTYIFDGELAVKMLQTNNGSMSGLYKYAQRTNDANGTYYPVAYKITDEMPYWSIYNVYESGEIKFATTEKRISGYTSATGAESKKKDNAPQTSQTQTQQSSQSASNSSKSNQTQQQSSNNSTTDSSKLEAAKKRLDSTHDGYAYTIKYSSKVYGHTDSSGIYEKFGLVTDSGAPLHLEAAPKDNNNLMQWTEKDFIQAVLPMADTSMIQDYKTVDHGSYQEIRATVQTENMSKYFRVIDSTNGGIRVLAEIEVFSDTPEKDKYDLLASLDSITMK